jgi:hypothetical protein
VPGRRRLTAVKPPRYRCHACAATFTAWSPAERHADAEHHHRIALILEPKGAR